MKNSKKILVAVVIIILIAGIIVTAALGLNKELRYQELQSFDIYLEQNFDMSKIKQIANDVLGKKNIVETVEIYKDMITIEAPSISEDQKNEIVNKIKESYEFSQTAENTTINKVPTLRIMDMFKSYVIPFVISAIVILAYMLIKYYKVGLLKLLARTILIPVIGELVLLSVMAITRIPFGEFTPILVIAVYIATIAYAINKNEKDIETKTTEVTEKTA